VTKRQNPEKARNIAFFNE